MNKLIEEKIKKCEERLKEAMLHSDISELDKLLAVDLIFTNHLGQLMTKQDDLEAHKSKILKIDKITLTDQIIKIIEDIAIITVKAHIIGSFNEEKSENNFRFTRVWSKTSSDTWQIIAGHSSIMV
ncbi:MAG: nuclear transport factor 2 family protein [Thiohalomonadales bacterium]